MSKYLDRLRAIDAEKNGRPAPTKLTEALLAVLSVARLGTFRPAPPVA